MLQLGSGAQESMTHGSVPAEASFFFFSLLYLLVQGSGVFIFFLVFTMHLVSKKKHQLFSVPQYCLVYT